MACRQECTLIRRQYKISGTVQGVGFRPFIFRLAEQLKLTGSVCNSPSGVELEIQGSAAALAEFEARLYSEAPPLAEICSLSSLSAEVVATETAFIILPSSGGTPDIRIAPDSAVCGDCLREMLDPTDRRYRYPFITCTNCGPRYSIITGVPYDRPNTTMAQFPLCLECLEEYRNPLDRRFHAQPIACHTCGPQIRLLTAEGVEIAERAVALSLTIELLQKGNIFAIKGMGGYHLAVDAFDEAAVRKLRQRKKRDEKPFAIMAADLSTAKRLVSLNPMEERLIASPEAPVVIVPKKTGSGLAEMIAPGNGWLGVMLPYTPLHQLLFHPSPFTLHPSFTALVMTSGNISDEPIAFEDVDALSRLSGIADYFLLHDRPIHIRSDDSVVRVFQGKPLFYRRARGYAPRALPLPLTLPPLLATGAELKSCICLADGSSAVLSQHIGDLQNSATRGSYGMTAAHLSTLLAIKPELLVCDLHPDYLSTRFAEESGLPVARVQHHHAHMAACMAENGLDGDVVGIIFDGTGYGSDGTVWGGEFLVGGYAGYTRAGHLLTLPLPGGDAAIREPWRMALSWLYRCCGDEAFNIDHPVSRSLQAAEKPLFKQMLERGINSPLTSSCGRLFDAVAALLDIRQKVSYDGQAAIELEALAEQDSSFPPDRYPYHLIALPDRPFQLDFTETIRQILADYLANKPHAAIACRFHRTVAAAAAEACRIAASAADLDRVVLSGGVFQNRLLTEMIYTDLANSGLKVYTHRLVPPNDGGIALGQAVIAGKRSS